MGVIFNSWHTRTRVMVVVVCLSVCASVTTKPATYLVYMSKTSHHMVLYGVFQVFFVWL